MIACLLISVVLFYWAAWWWVRREIRLLQDEEFGAYHDGGIDPTRDVGRGAAGELTQVIAMKRKGRVVSGAPDVAFPQVEDAR